LGQLKHTLYQFKNARRCYVFGCFLCAIAETGIFLYTKSMEPKTILLVEDEPLLGNLLRQRLEREQCKVILVHDGEEALSILRSTKPDLMLLDIILPKISGFELMEMMQADTQISRVPIIIISNLGQDSDIAKGETLGAARYFIKAKISIEDLVAQVKNFLGGAGTAPAQGLSTGGK